MNRATYSPGIARLDTVSRLDRFLRDRETPIGPSYVQSILFGRRWMRGTPAAADQRLAPQANKEGPDPCAS
jgi:hypothetical protein